MIRLADETIAAGQDVLIYTSRKLITGQDIVSSMEIGQTVSTALVEIVQRLSVKPGWIIAKGGITSSDTATRGLGVRQTSAGVGAGHSRRAGVAHGLGNPLARFGLRSFPGNVGGPDAMAEMVQSLRGNV